jgi:hypothetical protein
MTPKYDADTRKQIAQKVSKKMTAYGGYLQNSKRQMAVSSEASIWTEEEAYHVYLNGKLHLDFLLHFSREFIAATKRPNYHITPLYRFIDNPNTPELVDLQRIVIENRPPSRIFRTDSATPEFLFERQSQSALGMPFSIKQAYEDEFDKHHLNLKPLGSNALFLSTLTTIINSYPTEGVVIIITTGDYVESEKYLCTQLQEKSGFDVIIMTEKQLIAIDGCFVDTAQIPPPQRFINGRAKPGFMPIRYIIRRGWNLRDLICLNNWRNLFDAYLENQVGILPELNPLEDSKFPLAFLSSKFVYIPDKYKNLYPTSGLIPSEFDEPFHFGGVLLTLNQIIDMSKRQRKFVIKYCGDDIRHGCFGGRQVYRLFNTTANNTKKLLIWAITQVRAGHPWMIQEVNLTHFQLESLDKNTGDLRYDDKLHARHMIFYAQDDNQHVQIINGMVNYRSLWKAAGANDAIVAPIYTAPNAQVQTLPENAHYNRRIVQLVD